MNRVDRFKGHTIYSALMLLSAFLIMPFGQLHMQTLEVDGTVTTPTVPVENASVTFIDNSDTTRQFSAVTNSAGEYTIGLATSVSSDNSQPTAFELEQNYPNPFSSSTAISYTLDKAVEAQVTIYDILGREIKRFTVGPGEAGRYRVVWHGLNNRGERVPAGVYFYRLQANGETQVKKMVLGSGFPHSAVSFSGSAHSRTGGLSKTSSSTGESEYTIRIDNTDRTVPRIVPAEYPAVSVSSDTTIHFTVEEQIETEPAIVYPDSTHQIIRGFGAANIVNWRPDMTSEEIDKAFSVGDSALGFSILRLRIPPQENEWSSYVPTAQAAHDMGVKIIASPWTPPASMKTNNSPVGGRLREDAYDDFADHLNSFADFMAENDVPLYAVSVQNEPDVNVNYESCDYNGAEMLRFMKDYAPEVGVPVFAPESYRFDHSLSDPILNDSVATSNLAFVGGHIYGGGLEPYPLAREKGKELWMTEHLDTDISWDAVFDTGKEIHDVMLADMSAYIWWYIVRFYGPIHDGVDWDGDDIEDDTEKGVITKRGYIMSQFSRFIRPGYHRIEATENPTSSIHLSAYTNNERIVIVVLNTGGQAVNQSFNIKNGTVSSLIPYTTTETEDVVQKSEITVTNGGFHATLPASSITTFVSE